MNHWNNGENKMCGDVKALLSDYVDNTLSARQVWEVEKHLAACRECAEDAHRLQATVQILRAAPRFDTGDRFMASLHARLDDLNQAEPPVRSVWSRIRDWFAGEQGLARGFGAVSLGLAAASAALLLALSRPEPDAIVAAPPTAAAAEGVHISVAASANNPFSDPAADNLQYRSNAPDTGRPSVNM